MIVIFRLNSSKLKAEIFRIFSSFSSFIFVFFVCFLAFCYFTGDFVRDKCVEMFLAVLKAEGERVWVRGGEGRVF